MTASTFSIAANWVTINVRIGSHGLIACVSEAAAITSVRVLFRGKFSCD